MNEDHCGWLNDATYRYARVVFSDLALLGQVKDRILHGMYGYTQFVNLVKRGINWEGDVDVRAIILRIMDNMGTSITPDREKQVTAWMQGVHFSGNPVTKKNESLNSQEEGLYKDPHTLNKGKENANMTLKTVHYINGKDIATMSLDEKVALVTTTEKKIAELYAVVTKSTMISDEIKRLKQALADAVTLFDAPQK